VQNKQMLNLNESRHAKSVVISKPSPKQTSCDPCFNR
jgi:hypothetical protein